MVVVANGIISGSIRRDGVRLGSTSHADIQRVAGVASASPNRRWKKINHARAFREKYQEQKLSLLVG